MPCRIMFFVMVFFIRSSFANDGSFYAMGNTLIPLKETTVQLKKEVLNLTRQDRFMQVDIYFEFYNPGEEKELLVGFVTPPAAGDISDEDAEHPQISDFMVMVNNAILPYKIARMEKTGFRLQDAIANGEDFVYHFTVKFKKGITVIRHSYQYAGGGSVENNYEFYYRLTTGTTWANQEIEDFELNIQMGDDKVFTAPYTFNTQKADWNIVGIGRMNNKALKDYSLGGTETSKRLIYIRKGMLQLKQKHFKPTSDLDLTLPRLHREIPFWCEPEEKNDFYELYGFFDKDTAVARIPRLNDYELRLYRNIGYARKGYDFKDPVLKQAFSKYIWYIPDPNITVKEFPDYYFHEEVQQLLIEEEKKRKK